MKITKENNLCTFVIPVHIEENNLEGLEFFKQAMNSIFKQTCQEWSVVLVNDHSKNRFLDEYVNRITSQQKQPIIYNHNASNLGAGCSRNIGIEIAYKSGSNIILFQDADDLSHPRRVEVTKEVFQTQNVDVVYSPFIPVDEYGNEIEPEKFPHHIKYIIANNNDPSVGRDVWKIIAAKKMYINLTSTTSVRIDVARNVPFPNKRSSEDSYTWMLYSAYGAVFHFIKEIPSKYRIPQTLKGTSLSTSIGKDNFYQDFAETHMEAYFECTKAALEKGTITQDEMKKLTSLVYSNLFDVLREAGMYELADMYTYKN